MHKLSNTVSPFKPCLEIWTQHEFGYYLQFGLQVPTVETFLIVFIFSKIP